MLERRRILSPLPPGQHAVERLPVQHIGEAPQLDPAGYRLNLTGELGAPRVFGAAELRERSTTEIEADFHAAIGWSVRGLRWRGVRLADLLALARPAATARHVLFSDGRGYEATLTLEEALAPDVLVATALDGAALTTEHGAPARLVAPAKYGFKSVKWLVRVEVCAEARQGFWESRGAHWGADPWREERWA